jgi:hypothetical protein
MDILTKIIEDEGHCGLWAKPDICKRCPMSMLKQKADGSYLSCIEALAAQDLSEEKADALYKEAAIRLALNEAVDDLLIGEPDGDK